MKPLLSIVVPVYNAEAFVSKTIENLIKEDLDKEIILVNDGSTDNSLKVLTSYANKYHYIKVINQKNKGVSAARNAGINAANGKYIYFIDCDDQIDSGSLQRAINYFHIYKNIELVSFSYKHIGADGNNYGSIKYLPTNFYSITEWSNDIESLIKSYIISNTGTSIRKLAIIKKYNIRFNETLNIYEDLIFGFDYLFYVNNLFYINESLHSYIHINPNSLYHNYQPTKVLAIPKLIYSIEKFFFKNNPNKTTHTYIYTYTQMLFYSAVKNEAEHLSFFSTTAKENLNILANSSYLEYCNKKNSILPKSYYYCLANHYYTLLMIIAGIRPRTKKLLWNTIYPIGKFIKRNILRI